ncbi:MAG: hypothetical protein N2110_09595 [Flavobacteriales bacterium]|nr:hypothetical protein [Flavobacteriales bacterium]MCX7769256.1 hypothetical protein [Flavobacteriales bacterium]MDW8410001.1 hypothetical protein [Flavobacteriales bacterium]
MRSILFIYLLLTLGLIPNVKAQPPACEKVKELLEWSKDNFRAVRGPEVSRKKEQSGREIVTYKSQADLEGMDQEEIVYDFEYSFRARFGSFFNDRESAMDQFRSLTDHLKGCLAGYRYKESDKNINDTYEYKGGFTPAGGETATVAVFVQREPQSKKFYVQLWVKGLKRPY